MHYSKTLQSTTTAETEYVYDTSEFTDWSGSILSLRWDPVDFVFNQSFTLKSITFDLADGSTREFDFTAKEAYDEYLTLENLKFVRYGDSANEADYDPYCYCVVNFIYLIFSRKRGILFTIKTKNLRILNDRI